MAQITPDMTVASVVETWPDAARIFAAYGLACASCSISKGETIAQAVGGHGRGRVQMDPLMRQLNELAATGNMPADLPESPPAPSGGPKGVAQQAGVKHVIAVMSGKGGVGKSLVAGLLGAAVSLGVGILLGGVAGFYGGWLDEVIMRGAELFLALPWLYLLFAVRMSLPLQIAPAQAFLLIVTVVGVVGWARPARLIRGVVLSARARDYVLAARSAGGSDPYLLRRHVLPQVVGIALTQAALLAPQYVLAEVTLSFFGLGVGEPVASWGNMLSGLNRYHVLASYWWMFLPGIALIPVFLLYYALADALHQRATTYAQ